MPEFTMLFSRDEPSLPADARSLDLFTNERRVPVGVTSAQPPQTSSLGARLWRNVADEERYIEAWVFLDNNYWRLGILCGVVFLAVFGGLALLNIVLTRDSNVVPDKVQQNVLNESSLKHAPLSPSSLPVTPVPMPSTSDSDSQKPRSGHTHNTVKRVAKSRMLRPWVPPPTTYVVSDGSTDLAEPPGIDKQPPSPFVGRCDEEQSMRASLTWCNATQEPPPPFKMTAHKRSVVVSALTNIISKIRKKKNQPSTR
jgi:hypothetical protein